MPHISNIYWCFIISCLGLMIFFLISTASLNSVIFLKTPHRIFKSMKW